MLALFKVYNFHNSMKMTLLPPFHSVGLVTADAGISFKT